MFDISINSVNISTQPKSAAVSFFNGTHAHPIYSFFLEHIINARSSVIRNYVYHKIPVVYFMCVCVMKYPQIPGCKVIFMGISQDYEITME